MGLNPKRHPLLPRFAVVLLSISLTLWTACDKTGEGNAENNDGGRTADAGAGMDGGAASGGHAGTGGVAGTGGRVGAGGDVGTGGSGGSGGNAGTGGVAGTGGRVGAGGDAGTGGGQPSDVQVFVAQGYGGRVVVSCDGGRSWAFEIIGNGSNDDHAAYAPHGVAYADGRLAALWGWGTAPTVSVSEDGETWIEYVQPGNAWTQLLHVGDTFIGAGGHIGFYSDDAISWSDQVNLSFGEPAAIVRIYGAGAYMGGSAVVGVGGYGSATRFVYSHDEGRTWAPGSGPSQCGASIAYERGDILARDGVFHMINPDGLHCRSTDGGATWTAHDDLGDVDITDAINVEGSLYAYSGDRVFINTHGLGWSSRTMNRSIARVAFAHAVAGPSVSAGKRWAASNIDGSAFFYSSNGIDWTAASGGRPGTVISMMLAGHVAPGGACR